MKLVKYPNKILNTKVSQVNIEDPGFDPIELKKQMVEVMLDNNGIGLSANQVGLDAQVFVMGDKAENCTMCINPEILQHTEDTSVEIEGCLSFPGMYVKVKRPTEILAKWFDENLEEQSVKIDGYTAKCFLHEWDHLQGINMKDRVSQLKWDIATKKMKKYLK